MKRSLKEQSKRKCGTMEQMAQVVEVKRQEAGDV
jgi:hypothetical protein